MRSINDFSDEETKSLNEKIERLKSSNLTQHQFDEALADLFEKEGLFDEETKQYAIQMLKWSREETLKNQETINNIKH